MEEGRGVDSRGEMSLGPLTKLPVGSHSEEGGREGLALSLGSPWDGGVQLSLIEGKVGSRRASQKATASRAAGELASE